MGRAEVEAALFQVQLEEGRKEGVVHVLELELAQAKEALQIEKEKNTKHEEKATALLTELGRARTELRRKEEELKNCARMCKGVRKSWPRRTQSCAQRKGVE